ncbi:MAG: alanine racemase [Myxococcales bacterium]|nr:alanine racemase [Myxococcales bacterium]
MAPVTWVELSRSALRHNLLVLRSAAGHGDRTRRPLLCVMVKGNAYGHGLVPAARELAAAGADWLGTHDLTEITTLRAAGVALPLYQVGWLPPEQIECALHHDVRLTVYDPAVVDAAAAAARARGVPARLHVKVETGNNRQGLRPDDALALAVRIGRDPDLALEGLSTHFADIEDTTDHAFAQGQLSRFFACADAVRSALGLPPAGDAADRLLVHASNTAAVLLWPEVCGGLVRLGIGAYGLWPSKETHVSVRQLGKTPVDLQPVLTWKTRIAQVRAVPAGEWIGYGRTYRAVRPMRVAVLPVGYYDGYDRGLSNLGKVLVAGQRAPVVGRVAMNMTAVDVTDSPCAHSGDEVVLLGAQQGGRGAPGDRIRADEMAAWAGTIHYEVVTRINDRIERRVVDGDGPH